MTDKCECPETYPDWSAIDIDLGRHCVLSLSFPSFFHMPIAYELYMRKQQQEIENLELPERWPGFVLARAGMLGGRLLRLLEDVESPSRHVEYLPRPFNVAAQVHDGGIGTVRKTVGEMQMAIVDNGCLPKELYLGYLTCPVCEDSKGGPKIMVVRRWAESPRLKRRKKKQG